MFWKKKVSPVDKVLKTESSFLDNYNLYYRIYTGYLKNKDYSKVDNLAFTMFKIYDYVDKVAAGYDEELAKTNNENERNFILASKEYIVYSNTLMADVLREITTYVNSLKQIRKLTVNNASIEEIEALRINPDDLANKVEGFDERYSRIGEYKAKRDEAFSKLN